VVSSKWRDPVHIPRVLVAGTRGGGGKTLISLGLLAAWRRQGRTVVPFKKGPDYIDAAWLSRAAGTPCRNLDLFLMRPATVRRSFVAAAGRADAAVIEGNRGLFDGLDAAGTVSTAELAKLLQTPVVLVVDATKATRTVAAVVLGCQQLDPRVPLRGVVLNQTAGPRHEAVLRDAIRQVCGLPVVGALPRMPQLPFPERHLGLVPPQEHDHWDAALQQIADVAERHLDLAAMWDLAHAVPPLEGTDQPAAAPALPPELARIGVFRDAAFQFYYPENLEALARQGGRVVEISPLREAVLPEVDALYIGGGFPETLAAPLADNVSFRASLRRAVEAGLPVYAECGGAVYLGEQLLMSEQTYPMAGVLPVAFGFGTKPQGHGYAVLETVQDNPFFAVGDALRGHEFHYTYMQSAPPPDVTFAFRVHRGHGFDGERDGLCHRNVLASYTHVHALGTERWAPAVVAAATRFRSSAPASAGR
jgi:cobyrinic acid a,c-diamide synthase